MAVKTTKSVVLAVETSGRVGSVAAGIGDDILAKITFSGAMRHSAELFPATEQILAQIGRKIDDVGQIRIASGPGSFTGKLNRNLKTKIMLKARVKYHSAKDLPTGYSE